MPPRYPARVDAAVRRAPGSWLLPAALSLAALAAHFHRAANLPLALLCVAMIGLLAWPQGWAARSVQIGLAAGTLDWAWTGFALVQQRLALGLPWARLALILGTVTLATAASALLFEHPRLRARFGQAPSR